MEIFIATVCADYNEQTGRGAIIRKCLESHVQNPHLEATVFDFGSHGRQFGWLNSLPCKVWHNSPFEDLSWTLEGSERRRHLFAARLAAGEIYCVADDDCLPEQADWAERAEEAIRQNVGYGLLALGPTGGPSTHTGQTSGGEIVNTASVGGIRLVRRGALKTFPPYGGVRGYDMQMCAAYRAAGWKIGFLRNIRRQHLGGGNLSVYRERSWPCGEMDRPDGSAAEN